MTIVSKNVVDLNLKKEEKVLNFSDFQKQSLKFDIVKLQEAYLKIIQNKKFDDHLIHMLIHGVYHILGFDHENNKMAAQMENKEIKLLKKINIDNPY